MRRADIAVAAPGAVAAAALAEDASAPEGVAWLTSALHLTASLTTVHLDHAGLLRLDARTQRELSSSFDAHFGERGYRLEPIRSGGFLTWGPDPWAFNFRLSREEAIGFAEGASVVSASRS